MRILSQLGLWALCVSTVLCISPLPTTIPSAHAQVVTKTKRIVKRASKSKRKSKRKGKSKSKSKGKGKSKSKSKSVRQCMKFSQSLGVDEESVDLKLRSRCKFEVECSLEWELSCTGEDGAKSSSPASRSTSMDFTDDWRINASATSCEGDWEVGDVKWNCVASTNSATL